MNLNETFRAAMRDLVDEIARLVRGELRAFEERTLARLRGLQGALAIAAAAVLLAVLASLAAAVAVALLLATFLPPWLATLIVALVLALGAAGLFRQLPKAVGQARRHPPVRQIVHVRDAAE